MPNKPTTLREEWKQEFRKKFVIDFGDDIKPNLIIHDDIMEIADWWLEKFSSHSTELREKLNTRIIVAHKGTCNDCYPCGYNKALDDLANDPTFYKFLEDGLVERVDKLEKTKSNLPDLTPEQRELYGGIYNTAIEDVRKIIKSYFNEK